jgi:hypothetical protein
MACYIVTKTQPECFKIHDQQKIFDLLENNQITLLYSQTSMDISYYKRLLELLKINTSVLKLQIVYTSNNDNDHNDNDHNDNDDQFYKLLSDFLTIQTHPHTIYLVDRYISVRNCNLISDAIKNNTNVTNLDLFYNLDNNMFTYLVNSLKFNKTLTTIRIDLCNNIIDGKILAKLLKDNTTLTTLTLSSNVINEQYVLKSLKNNPYITYIYMPHISNTISAIKKINNYCDRNKYNNDLRSLVIQDL